jgi:hypothetical protein
MATPSHAAIAAAILAGLALGCSGGGTSGGELGSCEGSSYVGGDPGADADGDGLSNAAECAMGTNPLAADTDGDGLRDGAEVDAGTNPLVADTDGDGLSDGDEVAAGTSPLHPDTDGDGLPDGAEVAAGTNPLAADTDGDGLPDGDEAAAGTNPLVADTDGDGLLDGDEIVLGLDPRVADPPTAAFCDVLQTCARAALVPVAWEDQLRGDYRLALPADAVLGELFLLDSAFPRRIAATGFDLARSMVAGFVLSMDELVAGGDPSAQLGALAGRLAEAAGRGAPWSAAELVAGRRVQSWDGFPAVVGARVVLTGTTGNTGSVRQAVLASMAGIADAPFAGLPNGAFGAGPFVLSLEVLSRRNAEGDARRVVVVAAVAPKSSFDDKAQPTRIVSADLTGGTALGQSGDGAGTRCDAIAVEGDPRADFVWMSDISGSTEDERTPIRQNAAAVFGRLDNLGVDFRMGVVKHTSNRVTRRTPVGQLLGGGFTRDRATFEAWWSDTADQDGAEYGLTAIDDVVGPAGTALPRSTTEQASKVREGVKLVVVYVSDEHPQEVENACSSIVRDSCNLPRDADYPCRTDLAGDACIADVIRPFVENLLAEEAIAFGIIAPPPAGCATSAEVGWGYAETIAALGGSYGSVCASDPGETLDDIVSAVAGAASRFELPRRPIATTLKAVVTQAAPPACDPANPRPGRREVPRSQVDGFDYDPVSNAIFFAGASRPAQGETVTVSYQEWVDRTVDPNPDRPPCDCGGCDAGHFCETSICVCIPFPG